MWWEFRPYVSVGQRRANALKEIAKITKKGDKVDPVAIEGRKIAATFWGKAWCDNLESYADFAYRLERGRSYVRNGSVMDLKIARGKVTALVCGSSLYRVAVTIHPLEQSLWKTLQGRCAGRIASVIELLKGRISDHVMGIVTDRAAGLFPSPPQIEMQCSCPDYAVMCKHVAAALYGVGARLDAHPEMLFALRGVDHLDLVARAGDLADLTATSSADKTLSADDLADVFGIELDSADAVPAPAPSKSKASRKTAKSIGAEAVPLTDKRTPRKRSVGVIAGGKRVDAPALLKGGKAKPKRSTKKSAASATKKSRPGAKPSTAKVKAIQSEEKSPPAGRKSTARKATRFKKGGG